MKTINQMTIKELRELRSKICFSIINRGKLWYERLSSEQIGELREWYQNWLDVTMTNIIPQTPIWVNNTLQEEDEI